MLSTGVRERSRNLPPADPCVSLCDAGIARIRAAR